MRLTDEQRQLVEENMGLVKTVISQHVHNPSRLGGYDYDDLFQIGCIGLCKAAVNYKPKGKSFSIYTCIVIRNEIYDVLPKSSMIRKHGVLLEETLKAYSVPNPFLMEADVDKAFEAIRRDWDGISAKGMEAILLKNQGYSSAEIGEMYGVSANNVTAWIARARNRLKQDAAFMDSLALGA